jgi:hypothetical protein
MEDPVPEIRRRVFMVGGWRVFNVGTFLTIRSFLGGLSVTSAVSEHPSAIFCYECRRYATNCPFSWDPSGFLISTRLNDPNMRMISCIKVEHYNRIIGRREPVRYLTLKRLAEMDHWWEGKRIYTDFLEKPKEVG